jgi:hypothetical protein
MADAEVMVNNLAAVRDGRVWVPAEGASEFSLRLTPAVILVLEAAHAPVGCSALAGKLAAEFPQTGEARCTMLVAELLHARVLRSALRAPATTPDPASALPPGSLPAGGRGRAAVDMRLDASVRLPDAVATEAQTSGPMPPTSGGCAPVSPTGCCCPRGTSTCRWTSPATWTWTCSAPTSPGTRPLSCTRRRHRTPTGGSADARTASSSR